MLLAWGFAAGAIDSPAPAEAAPAAADLAGRGYCVKLARSLGWIGLAGPGELDIDPLGSIASERGIRGFETTMEMKK
jgi:hypothetical protein